MLKVWEFLNGKKTAIGFVGSFACRYFLPEGMGHELAMMFDLFGGGGLVHKGYKSKKKGN